MDDEQLYYQGLDAIGAVDGREVLFTKALRPFFSEGALHRHRAIVEIEQLIALSESDMPGRPQISPKEKDVLKSIPTSKNFDPRPVAQYDHFGRNAKGPFEHDVKSVEFYLREVLEERGLGRLKEFVHFPMTSEDVNNIAWNMMWRGAINKVWAPKVIEVTDQLANFSERYADTPVLGKTHGMNASPTTVGKRFAYHLDKLQNSLESIGNIRLNAKFSGPVGNHNAMREVLPDFDIEEYAREFVESLDFDYSPVENQRISHQNIVNVLDQVATANTFGIDICENVRHGITLGWYYLEGKPTHVGSSVMPHKVNPWFFEAGQGYFEASNALIAGAKAGLLNTTFERDMTDHPWERLYGTMVGLSLASFGYVSDGLGMLKVDERKCLYELAQTPEVLSEAVQIAGRLVGADDIYMRIKERTRGKSITANELADIINTEIPDSEMRKRLLDLTPVHYTGDASKIARAAVQRYKDARPELIQGLL